MFQVGWDSNFSFLLFRLCHENGSRVFVRTNRTENRIECQQKVKRSKWLIAGRNPFNSSNCVNMTKLCELILGSTQFRLLSTVHSINVDNYTALLSIALISFSSDNLEDKAQRGHSIQHERSGSLFRRYYCLLRHGNLLSYFGIFCPRNSTQIN